MSQIYVSFRREDSADVAARLIDVLREHFGAGEVLDDVNRLLPGQTPGKDLDELVGRAGAVVVVIGPRWASIDNSKGQQRLGNPNDFVRRELELALARGLPLVPVLVYDTPLPSADELPVSLQPLLQMAALRLPNDPDFEAGTRRIIDALDYALNRSAAAAPTPSPIMAAAAVPTAVPILPVMPNVPNAPVVLNAPNASSAPFVVPPVAPLPASSPSRSSLRVATSVLAGLLIGLLIGAVLLGAGIAIGGGRLPFALPGLGTHPTPAPAVTATRRAAQGPLVIHENLSIPCTGCQSDGPDIVLAAVAIDQSAHTMTWSFFITNHTSRTLSQHFSMLQIADASGATFTPTDLAQDSWTLPPGVTAQVVTSFAFVPQTDVRYIVTLAVAPPALTYQPLEFTLAMTQG
jgi:hypothetical protein